MRWLLQIAPYWVWGALLLLLLAVLILVGLMVLLRHARVQPAPADSADTAAALTSEFHRGRVQWLRLRLSFLHAIRSLRGHVAGRGYRYGVPWLLLIGEEGSGKSTIFAHTGMSRSWHSSPDSWNEHNELGWGFFDHGILIDSPGAFILRNDGISSDERGWHGLLRLLQRYRARRPLDGFLLTLPCRDLLDTSLSASASLQHKATVLFEKLWEAERILGMRLPVYVVVTQCDLVPGFQSFAQALSEDRRNDLFGWSNPYHLDTAFSGAWVDEAFLSMQEELQRLQGELFVGNRQIADPDQLFLFPGVFSRLREPLRTCLGRIFKETGYRESFFFRGVYFCGDLAGGAAAAASLPVAAWETPALAPETGSGSTSLAPEHEPVFLRRLFENRIFPEFGVAHPSRRSFLSRNRTAIAAQVSAVAAVLILSLGVFFSYRRLRRQERNVVVPFLQVIANDREHMKTAEPSPSITLNHNEYDLLDGMANLSSQSFQSWFLPASHFSAVHREIRDAMVPAFEQLVFKTTRLRLETRILRILLATPPASGSQDDVVLSVSQTPEYRNLETFGKNLLELQHFIGLYNKIRQPGQWIAPDQFESLVVYLGGRPLPEGFDYENNPNFRTALTRAQGAAFVCLPADRKRASQRLRELAAQLYNRWYGHNVLLDDSTVLEQQTEALMDRENGSQAAPDLSTLQTAISQLQGDLANPGLASIVQNHFSISSSLAGTLGAAFSRSCYLDPGLEPALVQQGQDQFNNLQQTLLQQSTSLTGPIFDASSGSLQLSSGLRQLQAGITHMQTLPFMSAPQTSSLSGTLPDGTVLLWNPEDLQQALSLDKSYDGFVQSALADVPWRLHDALRRLALRQLQHTIRHILGQAQQFQPVASDPGEVSLQQDIVPAVQNFQNTLPAVEKLQGMMRRWGDYTSEAELSSVSRAEALKLLDLLQQKFDEQAPYVIRHGDFSWWNGASPAAEGAFGAASADALNQYLAFQQSRVKSFAGLAGPLVTRLRGSSQGLSRAQALTLQTWTSIVDASTQAGSQNPNSSLLRLNAFIRGGMNTITPARGCAAPASRSGDAFDYFLRIRDRLRRQLQARCESIAVGGAWSSYTRLEDDFNEHLAGRFPFVARDQVSTAPGADPADLQNFLRLVEESAPAARRALLHTTRFGRSRLAALRFLDEAQQVAALFARMAPVGEHPAAPVFDIAARFRVNRSREAGGDRIIDWNFQAGSASASMDAKPAMLRWVYGQPVGLTLRWALNSPLLPAPAAPTADRAVNGHTLSISYAGPWSLLRLLRQYRAPATDFPTLEDVHPVTLALGSPTISGGGHPGPPTLVFVRLQLMPAGKKNVLALPEFPVRAPQLARSGGTE